MMKATVRLFVGAAIALCLSFQTSLAGTIIKLNLGGTGPDVTFSGGVFGKLTTVNDGDAGTTGDQNTNITFSDFLSYIPSTTGSYTLVDATAVGAPTTVFGAVAQNFTGGTFFLYDSSNVKLLEVNMASSALFGAQSGAFFNITNGTVVSGSLQPLLTSNSIQMSMSLTNISGGGLTIGGSPGNPLLNPFTGDATKEISATQGEVPEPAAVVIFLSALLVPMFRRNRP
jgi:hypothetical protein